MTDNAAKTALLSAGGTGGHLFPAEALAHELVGRGWTVHLATDARAERFTGRFPADTIHIISSATISGRNPVKLAKSALTLAYGYWSSRMLVRRLKPKVAVGFGGYPTLPPLIAAHRIGIPTVLHEQNAVLGRANKMLAKDARAIAAGFPLTGSYEGPRAAITGNPVRPPVLEVAEKPFVPPEPGGALRFLVFGGSQGAQYFSKIVPEAVKLLPPELIYCLRITQQARPEDEVALRDAFEALDAEARVATFFTDMPELIADAHLVMSRAGASTVSELAIIGRPSVLVPYPFALDHDQAANAMELSKSGGATIVAQKDLTAEKLAGILRDALEHPVTLTAKASAAKKAGKPKAAESLADLVEVVASRSKGSQAE